MCIELAIFGYGWRQIHSISILAYVTLNHFLRIPRWKFAPIWPSLATYTHKIGPFPFTPQGDAYL